MVVVPALVQAQESIEVVRKVQRPDGYQCPGMKGSIEFTSSGYMGGDVVSESGFAVLKVEPLGPAEHAGLAVGDTIAAVNDSTIHASRFLLKGAGTRMRIRVRRNGMTRDTALTMGALRTDSGGVQRCAPAGL